MRPKAVIQMSTIPIFVFPPDPTCATAVWMFVKSYHYITNWDIIGHWKDAVKIQTLNTDNKIVQFKGLSVKRQEQSLVIFCLTHILRSMHLNCKIDLVRYICNNPLLKF